MRDTGWTIGRLAGSGAPLTLAAALALGISACGGDSGDASGGQAMNQPATGAAEAPAGGPTAEAAEAPAGDPTAGATAVAEPAGGAAQELPAGVTAAMIDDGKKVYTGAGICFSCHGPDGKGVPNLGADLTDAEWLHSDGSYEGIVATVNAGVTAEKSSSGVPMPPKGGSTIDDAQVKAVAAYVWSLSHGGS